MVWLYTAKSKRIVSSGLKAFWHLAKQYIYWLQPNIIFFCLFFKSVITITCLQWVPQSQSLMHGVFFPAFRMIPYPLEKGHLFYPYPICTETADRELLPCTFNFSYHWHQGIVYLNHALLIAPNDFQVGSRAVRWQQTSGAHRCLKGSFRPSVIMISYL